MYDERILYAEFFTCTLRHIEQREPLGVLVKNILMSIDPILARNNANVVEGRGEGGRVGRYRGRRIPFLSFIIVEFEYRP